MISSLLCASILMLADPQTLRVATDGSGTHATVQGAIDAAGPGTRIEIAPGTYKEKLKVTQAKSKLSLIGLGKSPADVVLTYDDSASTERDGKKVGTTGSASANVNTNDFRAENLTWSNTAGDVGQAVAIKLSGDRNVFINCRFLGWQDTLYPHGGRMYFKDCYIEGRTDFIFGKSTAVFERCTIHSKNGGFVTAAASPPEQQYGFVFLDCELTGEGAKAYLGRPWRDGAYTLFLRCTLGDHIKPEGWAEWGGREKTARYYESQCTGPGADRAKRVPWSHAMSDDKAAEITARSVLAGDDDWDPTAR